jgi:hypothetical protein
VQGVNADIEQYLKGQADMIATYVQKLGKEDPAVTACLAVLEKLRTLGGRYAAIYEFMADPSFQPLSGEFSAKMMELATKASRPAPGAAPSIPSAAQAALGYHRAFESIANIAKLPRTREVYERIFALEKESAHAGEFVAKMAAEGLFAKMATVQMIEEYSGLTAQAESVAQPTMAAHNEFVLAAAQKATSAIEIEYESMRLFELNQLELRLDRTLVNDAFDIHNQGVESLSELLAEYRCSDQGNLVNRRGHIAERVDFFIGGGYIGCLADYETADFANQLFKFGLRIIDAVARYCGEFVERAAGEAQATTRDHRYFDARSRKPGREYERSLIAHATCGVLVGLSPFDRRKIETPAARRHRAREL